MFRTRSSKPPAAPSGRSPKEWAKGRHFSLSCRSGEMKSGNQHIFMNNKDFIYKRKIKDGGILLVCLMRKSDLKDLLKYANELSREKTFVLFQGEKVTLKQERRFVESHIRAMKQKAGISLLVFLDKELVGITEISSKKNSVLRHIGELGISVHRDARGKG